MKLGEIQLEEVLIAFSALSAIGFIGVALLVNHFEWIGYGYSLLYLFFSLALTISAWNRSRNKHIDASV